MLRKKIYLFASMAAIAAVAVSCRKLDKNSPGYEYMPDMYRTQSYKANEFNPFLAAYGGQHSSNLLPPDGAIAHSFDREKIMNYIPYAYANDPAGRDSAGLFLKSPLPKSEAHMAEGKRLYNIYCIACHGQDGQGDGPVVKLLETRDNLGLKPTPYNAEPLKSYTEGIIYHVVQYGKGNMGSYASQLNAYERWQIIQYVQELQNFGATADSTATGDSLTVEAPAVPAPAEPAHNEPAHH